MAEMMGNPWQNQAEFHVFFWHFLWLFRTLRLFFSGLFLFLWLFFVVSVVSVAFSEGLMFFFLILGYEKHPQKGMFGDILF